MKKKYAIGADVGGSHISVVAVDLEKEVLLNTSTSCCVVDNKASADEILDAWKCGIEKSLSCIDRNDLAGIGFAMPGPFDYSNGIALFTEVVDKFEKLYGVNIAVELKQRLDLADNVPVRFVNDATAFAIGEAWKGKSSESGKMIGITLGTGLGAAFVKSGVPVLEGDDVPDMGCLYHVPFKEGIANDYFSTGGFVKEYFKRTGKTIRGVKELARQVSTHPELVDIFNEFGTSFGEFMSPWMKKFNADCLVLGGNIVKAYHLFGPSFLATLESRNLDIRVELSDHMENSALMGSARLLDDEYWKNIQPLLPLM